MEQLLQLFNDISRYGLEKMGLYYSQYRGFVADVEDPEHYGRIKISVPEIYGDKVPNIWAWPVTNFAGKGYGMQCLPRKNDVVWIRFEKGNPRKPLWSYGYFGKGDKPESLKNYNNYWFKTPHGHVIEFNDTEDVIRITRAEGQKIEIDKDHIGLGSGLSASDWVAKGEKVKEKFESIISTLKTGPLVDTNTGVLLPGKILELEQLNVELEQILSTVIKID